MCVLCRALCRISICSNLYHEFYCYIMIYYVSYINSISGQPHVHVILSVLLEAGGSGSYFEVFQSEKDPISTTFRLPFKGVIKCHPFWGDQPSYKLYG